MIYIVEDRDIIGQYIGAIHSWQGTRPLKISRCKSHFQPLLPRINQIRRQILLSIFPLGFFDDTKEETCKLLRQIGDKLLHTSEKAQ